MLGFTLSLLGPFEASYGSRPLTTFRTNKVKALLIYLAVENERPVLREFLMNLLWPETPRESAQTNLRQALYQLRKAIPDLPAADGGDPLPLLLTEGQMVQIHPDCVYDCDVHTFRELLAGSISQWPLAAALYRGDFLSDFYLPDSTPFEEWAAAHRADLRRHALDTLEILTEQVLACGDCATAEAHARQQLALDSYRETAHRQLLTALAQSDRRAEAWAQAEKEGDWDAYFRLIDPELDNCRVALERSLITDDTESALQLATALAEYLTDHGMGQDAVRSLEKALAADGERSPVAIRAAAYLRLSYIWYETRGGRKATIELAQKGLALYQAIEDQEGVARALYSCGFAYHGYDWDRSRAYLNQSIAAYKEAGIEDMKSLQLLENIEISTGNFQEARAWVKQPVEPVALPHYQWLLSEVSDALSEEAYTAVWQKGYAVPVEDSLPLALQVMEQTAVEPQK